MTTVLYVHGLESGPRGRKARTLEQAGFTVVSHLMPCGRAQVLRDPALLAAASAAVAVVAGGTVVAGGWGVLGSATAAAVAAPFVASRLLRRVFRRSVGVQTRALAGARIDVVVGSSFGGAVALDLLLTGAWTGPTVLLCPAHQLVARRGWSPSPRSLTALPEAVASRVLVVHGRGDATVPVGDSRALVAGSRARLVLVDDDHRLSASATAANFAEWVARLGEGSSA